MFHPGRVCLPLLTPLRLSDRLVCPGQLPDHVPSADSRFPHGEYCTSPPLENLDLGVIGVIRTVCVCRSVTVGVFGANLKA